MNPKDFWTTWAGVVTAMTSLLGISFLVLVNLPLLWQNTWQKHLKTERFIFPHSCRGFIPCLQVPIDLGLWQDRTPWQEVCGGAKLISSWCLEEEREREEGAGDTLYSSRECFCDLFPPTRPCLLKFLPLPNSPLNYWFIIELIHLGGHSPHDPIISQRPHLWTLLH